MRDKSQRLTQANWANPLVMLHKYRFVVSFWYRMLRVYVYVCVFVVRVCVVCWCDESLSGRVSRFLYMNSRTVQTTTVSLAVRFECSFHWHNFAANSFNRIDIRSILISFLSISDLIQSNRKNVGQRQWGNGKKIHSILIWFLCKKISA